MIRFAEYLRDYAGPRSFGRLIRLPLDLTATIHPADFSTMLGLGVFAGVTAFGTRGKSRLFLAAAFMSTILIVAFGQLSARFFLEPYLWAGAAAVAASPGPRKALLFKALSLQGAATAIVAVGMAVILIPGAFSNGWRDRVMTAHANGYAEARWLDRTLRDSDVVLAVFRSSALIPRPFVGSDAANYSAEPFPKNIFSLARSSGATVLVLPVERNLTSTLAPCAVPDSPVRIFRSATRNPFKRSPDIQAQIFRLSPGNLQCAPKSTTVRRR